MSGDGTTDQRASRLRAVLAVTGTFLVVFVAALVLDVAVADRGVGVFTALSLDFGLLLVFSGLLTQFGDPWFLLLVATLVYLAGIDRAVVRDPSDGAFVLGVTFAAFSFTDLLKTAFAAPRPPGAGEVLVPTWVPPVLHGVLQSIATGGGYAFPSGHALGTTAVFAALAYKLDVGTIGTRSLVAAVSVILISGTRLLLGVHFFVDVITGAVAGLALFAVAVSAGDRTPRRVFGLGVLLGVLAVAATAWTPEGELWKAGQWLGGSAGAGLAWYAVRPTTYLTPVQTALVAVPVLGLWLLVYVTSPPLLVTVIGTALAAGTTIAAPAIADRLE